MPTSKFKQGHSQSSPKNERLVQPALSLCELEQQKRISMLEEQLASMSTSTSRNSGDKSLLSGNSPNSLATAHARLDGIETTVLNIQALLQTMSTASQQPSLPTHDDQQSSNEWPSMPRTKLFSDSEPSTQLVLLGSALSPAVSRKGSKRRKAITSPTVLNPSYNDQMDSGSDTYPFEFFGSRFGTGVIASNGNALCSLSHSSSTDSLPSCLSKHPNSRASLSFYTSLIE